MSFLIKFIASTLLRDNLRTKFEHKKQLVTKHVAAWQETRRQPRLCPYPELRQGTKGKGERKRRRGKRYANVVRFSPLHYSLAIKRNQKM